MGFDFGINKLYDKAGYFDKYGIHFIVCLFILFIWCSLLLYFQIKPNMQEIKNDWQNRKCDVKIMPIAGFINSPPGVSPLKQLRLLGQHIKQVVVF